MKEMIKRLALGTAQFGLDYGNNGSAKRISKDEVLKILLYAVEVGIRKLDTAESYGDAENILGELIASNSSLKGKFDIISKSDCGNKYELSELRLRARPYAYLVHEFEAFLRYGYGYTGPFAGKKGFSIYHLHELDYLLDKKVDFDLIQIPYSILDNKFALYLDELKKQNKEIYARSIFLNGRVFKRKPAADAVKVMGACLYFCLKEKRLDYIVVGIDSLAHLKQIVKTAEDICL